MTAPKYYVTTPIYYVNDRPHIGHAYTTLAADVMARFKRLDGYEVYFLTGTDEHGQKIQRSAEGKGITPQQFTDEVSAVFRDLADDFNFSNNDFIRTTEDRHKRACAELWRRLEAAGHIYLDKYAGWYAVSDEAFYDEAELKEGPDGSKIAPTGKPVEWVEEESYFFRLSAFEDRLLELYESQPDFILPKGRRNEVISFVKGGLQDLSISRTTFDWGVPVPGNERHVMYVWLDALTNYLTATGWPDAAPRWPADMHLVGKDILRFHAIYWPAFLMGADLPLPGRVFAHGWWTNEGEKISKSLGNVIDPYELKETFGLDQTRYFLLREVPFGNDGDFRREAMVTRMNSDLANNLGNLAQRSLSMIAKNLDGQVPAATLTAEDEALIAAAGTPLLDEVRGLLDVQAFNRALEAVWTVISEANVYIDAQAPWTLKKTDPERMASVLYTVIETVRRVTLILQPVMPESTAKLLDLVGQPAGKRDFAALEDRLVSGTNLPKPEGVFPRYVGAEA
jgi:methionyl-tRNA synthetase